MFINQNEIQELTGTDYRAAARYFIRQGCQIVIVTLGKGRTPHGTVKEQLTLEFEKHPKTLLPNEALSRANKDKQEVFRLASYVADANSEYVIESERGNTIDTTGAGDAFAAGFLFGFLRGKNLEECGYLGDLVASLSLTKIGARAGLPPLRQLEAKYAKLRGKPC